MSTTEQINQIFDEAMAMPAEARMILVESLIQASPCDSDIPDVPGKNIDEEESRRHWLKVCKQRWAAVQSGQSKLIDAEIVLAEARARLERNRK